MFKDNVNYVQDAGRDVGKSSRDIITKRKPEGDANIRLINSPDLLFTLNKISKTT